mmetsp:Transcript_28404/g.60523  ORF Transcript_28404/g.60523 Transcript_28404/m.60523 type:complete len:204 (-) Transcript_28404:329-940(-)
MMNHLMHAQRVASSAANTSLALPRKLHHLRPISNTPHFSALPAANSSEEPKTAQKKVIKEKKGPSASKMAAKESQANRITDLLIKSYDSPYRKPPEASEEEVERRCQVGRNYVIGSFKRHNELNHDLAVKIRMKQHALKMLPGEGHLGDESVNGESAYGRWKSEALKLNDMWGPPDHRHVPMYTPPIEGFDPNLYMDKEEEDN